MVKYLLQSDSELIEDLKKRDRQQRTLAAELQKKHCILKPENSNSMRSRRSSTARILPLRTPCFQPFFLKKLLARERNWRSARERLEDEISRAERSLQTPEFEEELKQPAAARPAPIRTIKEGSLASNAPEAAKIMKSTRPVDKSARLGSAAATKACCPADKGECRHRNNGDSQGRSL